MNYVLSKLALALWLASFSPADSPTVTSLPKPRLNIDLVKLGWADSPLESDKSFFRGFSIEKLEALDGGPRLVFLNDDLLIAYHAIQDSQEDRDWRTVRRELEAFFIRISDGALLEKKRWRTRWRRSLCECYDTEARLIRVSSDSFIVHANGQLMLYSSNLQLLKEKTLEPAGLSDIWAVKSVPGSRYILLRHGSPSRMYATYSRVAPDTLDSEYQIESSDLESVVAAEDSMIGVSSSGVQMLDRDKHSRILCADAQCREVRITLLSRHAIAFSGRRGIGVIDTIQGLLWSDEIPLEYVPQFGQLHSAASGGRFAVDVYTPGKGKAVFHGVKVGADDTMFIYDMDKPIPVYVLRLPGLNEYALSPKGTQIAVFDAGKLKLSIHSVT